MSNIPTVLIYRTAARTHVNQCQKFVWNALGDASKVADSRVNLNGYVFSLGSLSSWLVGKPNELVVYHGLSTFNLDNLSLLRKWHFWPTENTTVISGSIPSRTGDGKRSGVPSRTTLDDSDKFHPSNYLQYVSICFTKYSEKNIQECWKNSYPPYIPLYFSHPLSEKTWVFIGNVHISGDQGGVSPFGGWESSSGRWSLKGFVGSKPL